MHPKFQYHNPFLNRRNRKYAPMLKKTSFDGSLGKKGNFSSTVSCRCSGLLPNHLGYLYGEVLVFAPATVDVEFIGGNVPKKQWTLKDVRFRSCTECFQALIKADYIP